MGESKRKREVAAAAEAAARVTQVVDTLGARMHVRWDVAASAARLHPSLMRSVCEALDRPWVLEIAP